MTDENKPQPAMGDVPVELLSDLFEFLGGVDDAADLRERLLVELRHHELSGTPSPNPESLGDDVVARLRQCPDISHARIVAPGDRVPEVVVPTTLRDEATATIATLQAEKADLKEQLQFAAELAAERGKNVATLQAKLERVTEAGVKLLDLINERGPLHHSWQEIGAAMDEFSAALSNQESGNGPE